MVESNLKQYMKIFTVTISVKREGYIFVELGKSYSEKEVKNDAEAVGVFLLYDFRKQEGDLIGRINVETSNSK